MSIICPFPSVEELPGSAQPVEAAHSSMAQEPSWALKPIDLGESFPIAYPTHALGEWGSTAANAIQNLTQAPAGICAQSVLGAMSAVASLRGGVETLYGTEMPSAVMLTTIALSGERKSTADAMATKGITRFEGQLRHQLAEILATEEANSTGRGKAAKAPPQKSAEVMVSDPTIEGLFDVMTHGPGTAYLANDDAAGFFGGHAMSADQRRKTIAAIASLFSGTPIKRPRAHGQNTVIAGVPLSMHLMFQPYLVGTIYADRELLEQGILPRILPVFPESNFGRRLFRESTSEDLQVVKAFQEHSFEFLEEAYADRQIAIASGNGLMPEGRALRLSEGARRALIELYNEVEIECGDGGAFANIRSFATRAAENATRIAAIGTAFDNPTAHQVGEDAALNACDLMRFYLGSYRHVCGVASEKRKSTDAMELGGWLYGQFGAGSATHDKQVSQFAPVKFRDMATRRATLDILAEHGWIRYLPANTEVDGAKRQIAFEIHSDLARMF